MMDLPRRLKKKVRKTLVFFVKFAKRLITMQKNVGTKANPNVKFVKTLAMLKRIASTRYESKQIFCEKQEEKREENLYFDYKCDSSTKSNE